ncbi:TrkA C-terminal domain-containing protein [Tepidibacter formicigenes]|jgi:K+/H+ antiporter YhaU regulatory subunit KhtT|uniref:Transcriptional regulator, GntR family n=1 Tax=Tepidibacter formicigenes DSM 15518 TaxID=1123349 RepID=A0A1M6NVS4_9FIRM|nr:TrkA C-terminal domain-containing protein [Tepidibacter formicigenes]SHJ99806.1 transcriptional regulator, GntR family [Tepidibacter formicigenes DSM 15518]
MSERISIPRYIKIAVDVATRIYNGNINEGDKLRGRSILASEYNVSPETIRKAMKLLEDKQVVEVSKGSGIIVKSKQKAYGVIQNFKDSEENISTLRSKLKDLFDEKKRIEKEIQETTEKIIDLYKFKRNEIIDPIQVEIKEGYHIIGKTIGECKVWENTGATILGVLRKGKMILSPGPNLEFMQGDNLLIVGDLGVVDKINNYLKLK